MHHRVLSRDVPLRRSDFRGLAGRSDSSFRPAFLVRRHSWDLRPFAGLLPRTGGATFLPRRAHVSFSPRVRPDLFSSGCRPPSGKRDQKRRSASDLVVGVAFDFWASLPSAVRSRLRHRRSILPWALPLAGLWALCCAFDRARPRSDHQPPGSRARMHASRASQSAHGF